MSKKLAFLLVVSNAMFAETNTTLYQLDATVIEANLFPYQNGEQISTQTLQSNPTGNGDITSILKMLPNVQFDSKQLNSVSPGEIDPANISISGGLFYQNAFMIDGMSMNNDLTGGVGTATSSVGYSEDYTPAEQRGFKGRSQGLNIDTSLLESIKVQDSNIGASYGGFTGGVVEATTKRAEKDFGANLSYQISQGNASSEAFSLTRYHIYGDKESFFNSTLGINQPKFVKHGFRSSLESKLNERLGIIASFTTMQSIIPRKSPESMDEHSQEVLYKDKKELRQSYNFFIKAHYQATDKMLLEAQYAFMPQYNRYFDSEVKDSDTTIQTGGHQAGLKALINNKLGFFTAQTNVNFFEESRRSKKATQKQWNYSPTKNWGNSSGSSWEGGLGDEDMKQNEFDIKLTQNIEPYVGEKFENAVNFGAELGYTKAYFHRLKDSYTALTADALNADTCIDEFCYFNPGTNEGQYFIMLNKYKAGKFKLGSTTMALFVEDEIKFDLGEQGGIRTRFGLRMDYDTYMSKAPIAPRFALSYIAPWGGGIDKRLNTSLNFGANRYYGRSLFAYRLSDGLETLEETYMRMNDAAIPFDTNTLIDTGLNTTNFKKIKIPYDDELSAGITQQLGLFDFNAKYIHRFGKDQVRRTCILDENGDCPMLAVYTYDNSGTSKADIFTISLTNAIPFRLNYINNYFSFAYDYTDIRRNYNDYSENYNAAELNNWVLYNGTLMRLTQINVSNFARPYTLRFSTTHQFKLGKTNYLINNFLRYRGAYTTTIETGNGNGLQDNPYIYEDIHIGGSFTWDMRVGFDINVKKRHTFYTNIDIFNVLDKATLAIYKNSKSNPRLTYEVGRQFWVQVGYRY